MLLTRTSVVLVVVVSVVAMAWELSAATIGVTTSVLSCMVAVPALVLHRTSIAWPAPTPVTRAWVATGNALPGGAKEDSLYISRSV
jgi:hypothetical protein